jgi:hypothetical protein
LTPDPPAIGDIRYHVFVDTDNGHPFVSRMRLVTTSPGGRKGRWIALGVHERPVLSFDADNPPAATQDEAVTRFQESEIGLTFGVRTAAESVRHILAAERLRGELAGKRAAKEADRAVEDDGWGAWV